jgi:ribonucleoside-diphosphate reductase alpha chain
MTTSTTALNTGLTIERVFSKEGVDPISEIEWSTRDAVIYDASGKVVFEQKNVRVPAAWSQTATNIVASKYFHGLQGTPEREDGADLLIARVVSAIVRWGIADGYFATNEDADTFRAELTTLLINQIAAFNSPVWFNVGYDDLEPNSSSGSWQWDPHTSSIIYAKDGYQHPQVSACFINAVEDSMESIMNLAKTEAMLFKWGSGTGSNMSAIRGSMETLSGGGLASGPLSFMRGFDAFAGVIKSGGKTRRAAKMAILNVDHPDIEAFITCKGKEEAKAKALMAMGYDGSTPDSEAYSSIFYQNANNSVRVTDEFMEQATSDGEWNLTARKDGRTIRTVKAKEILHKIAEQTWRCGDPGMQFDTTINKWHTSKNSGRIDASNPCSEYMFLNNSACNLASFNLVKFLTPDGTFDVQRFEAAIYIFVIAMDILVDHAGYPTEEIARNSHDFRPLGLGYSNLGGMLLRKRLPYDSEEGRAIAAAITAIMTGKANLTSALLAEALQPLPAAGDNLKKQINDEDEDAPVVTGMFPGYIVNEDSFLEVIDMHTKAARSLSKTADGLEKTAVFLWETARLMGGSYGYRNAQVSVLAPTGTIGFLMDVDTTGIEPVLGLVTHKKLVGGGFMTLAIASVSSALQALSYNFDQEVRILQWIAGHGTIEGAVDLKPEHLPIFDCALRPIQGTRSISWQGHLKMMAAVQPFLSGAISKTINMPKKSTVEDVMDAYIESWRLGLKAVAIYRDSSKSGQPVVQSKESKEEQTLPSLPEVAHLVDSAPLTGPPLANRHRLPSERDSLTHHFRVADHEGYITVGRYPNGAPGEVFLKMSKEGSTVSGLMDSIGILTSLCLQHGVTLKVLCQKLAHTRFEPSGWTGNPEIGYAKSLVDYIFRWMGSRFEEGKQLALFTASEPEPVVATRPAPDSISQEPKTITDMLEFGDAPTCSACGSVMSRSGSCYRCGSCGSTSGGCS